MSIARYVYAILTVLPMTTFGQSVGFERSNFISDPYMPFSRYETDEELNSDFQEKLGATYERIRDPRLEREAQKLVDIAFEGFKRKYPVMMANKEKPQYVIANSDDATDATAFMPRKHSDNHKGFMIFTSGFLNSKFSERAKLGFVAHEIAHLFLWHLDSDTTPIRVSYPHRAITKNELGAFKNFVHLSKKIGWIWLEEANGLTHQSEIGDGLDSLFEIAGQSKDTACTKIFAMGEGHQKGLNATYSHLAHDFLIDTHQKRAWLNQSSQNLIKAMRACIATLPPEANRVTVTPHTRLIFFLARSDFKLPNGDLNFDEYLKMAIAMQSQMRIFESQFESKQIRFYSGEDQADDASTGVLKTLGISIDDFSQSFLGELKGDKAACLALIKKGVEPPYGSLTDEHHATCWRVWNMRRFYEGDATIRGLR